MSSVDYCSTYIFTWPLRQHATICANLNPLGFPAEKMSQLVATSCDKTGNRGSVFSMEDRGGNVAPVANRLRLKARRISIVRLCRRCRNCRKELTLENSAEVEHGLGARRRRSPARVVEVYTRLISTRPRATCRCWALAALPRRRLTLPRRAVCRYTPPYRSLELPPMVSDATPPRLTPDRPVRLVWRQNGIRLSRCRRIRRVERPLARDRPTRRRPDTKSPGQYFRGNFK